MHYAIYKNSLTYGRISRDCALSRSPQVNMSVQARPPRRAMATYSRKSSLKKQTLTTVEIGAFADVHVDAPVVEDTEIYDEPPKETP